MQINFKNRSPGLIRDFFSLNLSQGRIPRAIDAMTDWAIVGLKHAVPEIFVSIIVVCIIQECCLVSNVFVDLVNFFLVLNNSLHT